MKTDFEVSYVHFIPRLGFYELIFDRKPPLTNMPITWVILGSDSLQFFLSLPPLSHTAIRSKNPSSPSDTLPGDLLNYITWFCRCICVLVLAHGSQRITTSLFSLPLTLTLHCSLLHCFSFLSFLVKYPVP